MQLISKYNKGVRFFLHFYSKYALVLTMKDKKGITVTNEFKKIR